MTPGTFPRNISSSCTSWQRREWMVLCSIILIIMGCTCCTSAVTVAYGPPSDHLFRCSRPFDALDAFSAASMHKKDNCAFSFIAVRNASVNVTCRHTSSSPKDVAETDAVPNVSTEQRDCTATVTVVMTQLEPLRSAEEGRFTVELRLVNDSVISYKGIDGNGYDMCCRMLDAPFAHCAWVTDDDDDHSSSHTQQQEDQEGSSAPVAASRSRSRQVVHHCSLLNDVTDGESGPTITGTVSKPLHRLGGSGAWEARIMFFRNGLSTPVGRVMIPFQVPAEGETLATDSSHTGTFSDAAMTSEAAASSSAVVAVADASSSTSANDDASKVAEL